MESEFLKQIEAEPGNRLHQLIFADWLEEQGDIRAGLLRMSECWVEYKIRCVIRDWGMPGFDTLTRFDVMESDNYGLGYLHAHDRWLLVAEGKMRRYSSIVLFVNDDAGRRMESVSRHDGRLVYQVSDHRPELQSELLMPPGWIGHKNAGQTV